MTQDEWEQITRAMVAKHWPMRYSFPPGDDNYREWFESVVGTIVADVGMILNGTLTIEQFEQ